jgi:HEAT repeat protein
MLKWLTGLIGPELQRVVTRDLKRLNAVKAGLGDAAVDYVSDGKNDTVLSTLAVHCKANELQVCTRYVRHDDSASTDRRAFLAHAHPYPYEAIQRYAEVLAVAGDLEHAPGTNATPKAIRALFGEAFLGVPVKANTYPQKAKPLNGKGLTVEAALEMIRRLGGSPIDFFDVVYARNVGYTAIGGELYRQAVDLKPVVESGPDAVVGAARRMTATSRAELIRDLSVWKMCAHPQLVPFLVEQAGDGAKAAREAASSALAGVDNAALVDLAIKLLGSGNVDQRAGMVDLLSRIRTPRALDALRAHRDSEKTARIVASIDTALAVATETALPHTDGDDASGYVALDGQRIAVPQLVPLATGTRPKFGDADRAVLRAAIADANTRTRQQNEDNAKRGFKYRAPLLDESMADQAVALFNHDPPKGPHAGNAQGFYGWGAGKSWTKGVLEKLPEADALKWAAWLSYTAQNGMRSAMGPGSDRIRKFLEGPSGDVRHLELIDIAAGVEIQHGHWLTRKSRTLQKGDFLRNVIQGGWRYGAGTFADLPQHAAWPYLAENLDVFDEALGLKPEGAVKLDRAAAIRVLTALPATPARFFAPLLEAATGVSRDGRAEARALLGDRPEVTRRLIALLDDSRQALRAGAAEWLAQRKDAGAVSALWARLKKEKSELARAAIVTALRRMGEDVSEVVGPDALIAEANRGLKSAKLDKLEWLGLDHLPRARFRGGNTAPRELLVWWIAVAYKLKQPGGNALFTLYLDQLEPEDAAAFSTWILDAWLAYDTARPSETDANAHAKQHAKGRLQSLLRWVTDYTEERAFADLHREYMSQYPNSGADSKGILALAIRTPSALAADRVRAYLKNHGQRPSQASALLEVLAGIGDPVALQVVIAAATRLKQKGVQQFAGELVAKIADSHDWSLDELADRTIPTAGFDDDGVLRLTCGQDARVYEGRLTNDLTVILRNPAGKEVAGVPAGTDEATKAAKKQLSTTKKELKQIATMQTARLYEALCAERSWPVGDWRQLYWEHPVMRRLVERAVWLGLDASNAIVGGFRPTAEGDLTNHADERVALDRFASVRLAHGALLPSETAAAWQRHLDDYDIKPLFAQFGRSLLKIQPEQASETEISDRKGWLTDTFTLRGAATKQGYERGEALDGGAFNEYRKSFNSAGITAVVEFTGSTLPEENIPAALIGLKFEKTSGARRSRGEAKLGEVPPVLLSECWNDYHAMAAKGAYDPEWQRKGLW